MKKYGLMPICLLLGLLLGGCQSNDAILYPTEEQVENNVNYSKDVTPTRVDKIETDNSGNTVCFVYADVVGSTDDAYPVYEVKKQKLSSEDLITLCNNVFDDGITDYLLPYMAADKDYLNSRIQVLEQREKEYKDEQKDFPKHFIDEKKYLEQMLLQYDASDAKLKLPKEPGWIDMKEFYKEKFGIEEKGQFFGAEGKIGEDYWRFEATDINGNLTVTMKKYEYGEAYFSYEEDESTYAYLGLETVVSKEEAIREANSFYEKTEIPGYNLNVVNPILKNVFYYEGELLELNENIGYQVTYSKSYDGRMQLYDVYSDCFGNQYYSKANCPDIDSLPLYFIDGFIQPEEMGDMTVTGYGACYESISFAVDQNGVFEMMWVSPMEIVEKKTDKAVLLEFDKILDCADVGFSFLEPSYNYSDGVSRIELSLARIKNNDGTYVMVPAWYFVSKGSDSTVRENTKVCVNAVDGSIIILQNGMEMHE